MAGDRPRGSAIESRHGLGDHRKSAYGSLMHAISPGPRHSHHRVSVDDSQAAPLLNRGDADTRKPNRRSQRRSEDAAEKPDKKVTRVNPEAHDTKHSRGNSAQEAYTQPVSPNASVKSSSKEPPMSSPSSGNKKATEAIDSPSRRAELAEQLQGLSRSQNLEEVTYTASSQSKDGGLMKRQRLSITTEDVDPTASSTSSPSNLQTRKTKAKLHKADDDEDEHSPDSKSKMGAVEEDEESWLEWMVHTNERTICVVITINCITMGLEMDYPWKGWFWVNQVMLAAYVVDIALRIYAQSWRDFIRGGWNWLDSIIVISSILDMWIIPFVTVSEESVSYIGSMTVILRLPRLLRIFRILTVVKAVRPLYNLLVGLSEAFSAIFWFLVLVCVLLYAFALIFHQMFSRGWESLSQEANEDAMQVFSTVINSFFSLFRVMSADMTDLGPLLSSCRDWALPLWYMAFQMCSSWLLLSTLTATVIDTVLGSKAKREREEEFRRVRDERDQVTEALQEHLGELANVYDELRVDELREFLEDTENADMLRKLVNKEPFEALQDWEALQIEGAVQLDDYIEHLQAGSYSHNVAGNVHRLESRVLRLQSSMDQVITFLPVLRNLSDRVAGMQKDMPMCGTASDGDSANQQGARRESRMTERRESVEGNIFRAARSASRVQVPPRIAAMPLDKSHDSSSFGASDNEEELDEVDEGPLPPARRAAITHATLMSPRATKAVEGAQQAMGRASVGCPEGRRSMLSPHGSRDASPRTSPRTEMCQSSALPGQDKAKQAEAEKPAIIASPKVQVTTPSISVISPDTKTDLSDQKNLYMSKEDGQDKFKELHHGIDDLRRELNDKVDELRRNLLDALHARGAQVSFGTPQDSTMTSTTMPSTTMPSTTMPSTTMPKAATTVAPAASRGETVKVSKEALRGEVVNFHELSNSIAKAIREGLAASAGGHAAGAPPAASLTIAPAASGGIDIIKTMDPSMAWGAEGDASGEHRGGRPSPTSQTASGSAAGAAPAEGAVSPTSASGTWRNSGATTTVHVPVLPLAPPSSHGDAAGGMTPTALRERGTRSTRSPMRLSRSSPDVARGRSPAHSSSATHSPDHSARS